MSNRINFGFADRQRREKSAVPTPSSTESLLHDLLLIAPDTSGLFDPQAEIRPQSSPMYQEVMRESLELQQYKQYLNSELVRIGQCEAQLHEWCQSHGYPYPTYHTYPQQYSQEQQHQHQQQQQQQQRQVHPQEPPADVPVYWSDKEVEDLFRGTMSESTSFVESQPQADQATQARVLPPTIAHPHLHPSDAFVVQSIAPHLLNNQPPPGTDNDSKASPWTPANSPPILPYSYPHTHAHSHVETMAQLSYPPLSPSEVSSKHSPNLKQNVALPSVLTLQLQTLSTKAPHSPLSPPLTPTSSSSLPPTPRKVRASSSSSFSSSPRASPSPSTKKPKMSPSRKSCSPRSMPYEKPTKAAPSSSDIKPMKKHTCKIDNCGKVFTRASNLRTHETTHSKVKPFPCVHPGCESKFARVHDMKRHLRNHTKDFPYACVICEDKRFVRNDPLWRHYHHDHKGDSRVPARKRRVPAGEVDRATFVKYIKTEEDDVEMENENGEVDDGDTDAEAEDI
ncbi:hypothetical protein BGZ93_003361 [Podila epicladia]|nr:hypothetical protein BGZ93_003361 [Podila epicladia]